LPDQVIDKFKKEHREFQIPKAERERSFYGTEFEIQLKNKLTQRAVWGYTSGWVPKTEVESPNGEVNSGH
jgi:hypothetical protein